MRTHPDPTSLCHTVLQQFARGLEDAGHTNAIVDLYAIGFNLALTNRDFPNWLPDENVSDIVEKVVKEHG
jgi:putative NADPH-quinone reductase